MGNVIKTYRKATGLEIAKRFARSTIGLQRMMDWALWWGRPALKWKKKLHTEQGPAI
jgi:hypothetical protein